MSQKEKLDLSKLTKKDFPLIKELSYEQEDMVIKLFKYQRVIVDSVAGSGKTCVLTQAMKALLDKGIIDTIYYVVFPVQENALGFLPGDLSKKIQEYGKPFREALIKAGVNPHEIDIEKMCNEEIPGKYKVVSHTFLRGRTVEGVGVLIDEAQNGTVFELKKVFTRITDDCYLGIAGHNGQIDIAKETSGFSRYIHYFKTGKESGIFPDIDFAELTHDFRGKFSRFSDQIPD